jgi:MFS family permease
MSDRYGRKIVLGLALLGLILGCIWSDIVCKLNYSPLLILRFLTHIIGWWSDVLPVQLTWFSSAFVLIGGGVAVITSMIFTIIADVIPDAQR